MRPILVSLPVSLCCITLPVRACNDSERASKCQHALGDSPAPQQAVAHQVCRRAPHKQPLQQPHHQRRPLARAMAAACCPRLAQNALLLRPARPPACQPPAALQQAGSPQTQDACPGMSAHPTAVMRHSQSCRQLQRGNLLFAALLPWHVSHLPHFAGRLASGQCFLQHVSQLCKHALVRRSTSEANFLASTRRKQGTSCATQTADKLRPEQEAPGRSLPSCSAV